LNTNGTLDSSFNAGAGANGSVLAVAIQNGTNVLVGGSFTSFDSHACGYFARLKSDGSFDTGFHVSTASGSSVIHTIATEPSGNILIGGEFTQYSGTRRTYIARLDTNGNLVIGPLDSDLHLQLSGLNYTNGPASMELHVSDGQAYSPAGIPYLDPTLFLNASVWWEPQVISTCNKSDDLQLFAGYSVPTAGDPCGLRLWDIKEKSLSAFLTNSNPQSLTLSSINSAEPTGGDYISLVLAMAKLPPGTITTSGTAQSIPTNLPPVARADTATVHHATRVQIIDVLGNDSSPTGTLLSVAKAGSAGHGTTEPVYNNSAILYTPEPGYSGPDSFSYTAIDAYGNTSTATVSLTVDGVDPVPLGCGQSVFAMLGSSGVQTTIRGASQPADVYKFSAISGSFLSITVGSNVFKSHIYLRDPLGELVASGCHGLSDGSSTLSYLAEKTGAYTLEVTSHSSVESGNYTLTANYSLSPYTPCAPHWFMEVWADGAKVPYGGTIDLGTDVSKQITIKNTGSTDIPNSLADLNYNTNFVIAPASDDYLSQSQLAPLPPNVSRTVTVSVTNTIPGSKTGTFSLTDGSGYTALLSAYVNPAGTPPSVTLTAPGSNTIYYTPDSIALAATASVPTGSITKVEFFARTAKGRIKIGEDSTAPYTITWPNPPTGPCLLSARATDSAGRMTSATPVPIIIANRPPNHPPVASNDFVNVFKNTVANRLNVLTNDYDPDGDSLTIISTDATNGTVSIAPGGQALLYTPLTNSYGADILHYTITDGHNTNAHAKVYVSVIESTVQITQPYDTFQTNLGAPVTITATASTSQGAIGMVEFYANNKSIGQQWTAPYETTFTSSTGGVFVLKAAALDTKGFITWSDPVRIHFGTNNDQPVAEISNLVDGQVIREGSFDLVGTASNLDSSVSVGYHVRLYRPDDGVATPEQRFVAELIPTTVERKANEVLGRLDFSMVRNGAYVLELEVDSFTGSNIFNSLTQPVTIILDSNLKVGQFTFSEQDLVVPAGGIPLTVVRTYSSINPALGDFGQSWTFAVNDVDMEIDEQRATTTAATGPDFNMRVGGGRDVTLTMPDGRRTTFYYYQEQGLCNSGDEAQFCLLSKWKAPYGINATLTPLDDTRMVVLWAGVQNWIENPAAGIENFDFSGFALETADGTRFEIHRDDFHEHTYLADSVSHTVHAYGKGRLKTISTRAGDRIVLGNQSIQHFDTNGVLTRSLLIGRTNNNLISAIWAPSAQLAGTLPDQTIAGPRPSLKYEYDTNNNLIAVYKLVNTNTSVAESNAYLKTSYEYTNLNFPHFLTGIIDPRDVPAARTKYDPNGRMLEMTDAAGNTTHFEHDLDNRRETIIDPMTNRTVHIFDERGNVTVSIDAQSHITTRAYDQDNNLLSETDPLSHTISHTYDTNGLTLSTADPMGRTNFTAYDGHGQVVSSTDPVGIVTTNIYDDAGNLTGTKRLDGQTVLEASSYVYQGGLLAATLNANGDTTTMFSYDSLGNLASTTDANGFTRSFGYDVNGNQVRSTYTWTGPGGTVTVTNRTDYDPQGRVIQTVDALGNTNRTFYSALGKVDYTIDALGNTNSFVYDVMGRVIQATARDGTFTRTVYDVLGRTIATTDRFQTNGTRTDYDSLGRVLGTTKLQGLQISIIDDTNHPGQLMSMVVSNGAPIAASATEYFADGRVKSRTGSEGLPTSYTYYDDGQVQSTTDPLGKVISYAYDSAGRQQFVVDALNHSSQFVYDGAGRNIKTIFTDNTFVTNIFNGLGQQVGRKDQAGVLVSNVFNLSGQLTSVVMPSVPDPENGNNATNPAWIYAFDQYGRQISMTDAKGRSTTNVFDAYGRQISTRLPLGETNFVAYDSFGRVSNRFDFKHQMELMRYDRLGRVSTNFWFAAGSTYPSNSTEYYYNGFGQLTNITERSGTNSSGTYAGVTTKRKWYVALVPNAVRRAPPGVLGDAGGLGVAITAFLALLLLPEDRRLRLLEILRCGAARPMSARALRRQRSGIRLRVRLPGLFWRCATAGLLVSLIGNDPALDHVWTARAECVYPSNPSTDTVRVTTFAYDFEGRLTQQNTPEGVINYEYDAMTGRHTRTCSTNTEVAYGYDSLGRLSSAQALKRNGINITEASTTYTYDAVGNRSTVTLPNGVVTTYLYDSLNRLTNVTHKLSGTNLLASYSYTLHSTGRRIGAVEILQTETNSPAWITNTMSWAYDQMYRLTNEVSVCSTSTGNYTNQFRYDLVGNRFSKTQVVPSGTSVTTNLFDANDQLLKEVTWTGSTMTESNAYGYDDNGSLIIKAHTDSGGTTTLSYGYDLKNKLTRFTDASSTTTTFVYNDQGIRVRSTTGASSTLCLIDSNNHTGYQQILEELTAPGATPSRSYVIGDDVLGQTAGTAATWLLYDGHGSTRQLADASGAVSGRYNYDGYGSMLGTSTNGAPVTSMLYCGEQYDSALGMYNLRARYYNPANGRFNQRDAFAGDNFDPQSIHKYTYSYGDPVNGSDPTGQMTVGDMLLWVGAWVSVAGMYLASVVTVGRVLVGIFVLAAFLGSPDFRGEFVAAAGGPGEAAQLIATEIRFAYNTVAGLGSGTSKVVNEINVYNPKSGRRFERKLDRLVRTAESGNLTVVRGTDTIREPSQQARYRKAVFKRYVKLLQQKGMSQPEAEAFARKKFEELQADHKIDLQVSGSYDDPNGFWNLGMEDAKVNLSIGAQINSEIERLGLDTGDTIDKINIINRPQ
jgi:RHS repeat-associated protein